MIYDLHTHSNASDGILSPEQLVSRAKMQGVTHLALTDHDTVAGLVAARRAAEESGIDLINGVEFSCLWQGITVHIVGLNVQMDSPILEQALADLAEARESRATEIAERLAKLGFGDALAGAQRFAGEANIGRPHFARYLVEIGAVNSINSAFKKFLGAGKAGDVKQVWPDVAKVCDIIRAVKGMAVLAHPLRYTLTITKLRRCLDEFKQVGGEGIEVVSGQQTSNQTKSAVALAKRFDLAASCGSDFHVPDQPWQELGRFGSLPEECTPVWSCW